MTERRGSRVYVVLPIMLLRGPPNMKRQMLRTVVCSAISVVVIFFLVYCISLAVSSGGEMVYAGKTRLHLASKQLYRRPLHAQGVPQEVLDPLTIKFNVSLENRLLQKPSCRQNMLVQVLITSAPNNVAQRKAIRDTWCSKQGNHQSLTKLGLDPYTVSWQCVFLIAQSHDASIQQQIQREVLQYEDILLGSYKDSYRNLTTKVVSGFYWSHKYCSPKYIFKTDDDCFLNVPLLIWLLWQGDVPDAGLYAGHIYTTEKERTVIRADSSKWAISRSAYPEELYPPYAAGPGYLISGDILQRLLQESQYHLPFEVEDAYVGVLIDRIRVTPVQSYRFTMHHEKWTVCNLLYLLVIHGVTIHSSQQEWYDTSKAALQQCKEKPIASLN